MADTPSTKHGIPRVADTDFINSGPATIRAATDLIDVLMATAITTTPRPAASRFGRFHLDPDGTLSFDTGAAWVEVARHAHAAKHAAGGADPLTVSQAMLGADVSLPPLASIVATASPNLPASGRWSWADGSLIDKTTYAAFFADVGHAFNGGVDPGSNMVRVPDLRGRVPVGVDGAAGRQDVLDALGNSGGAQKHTLGSTELPSHTHAMSGSKKVPLADLIDYATGVQAGSSFSTWQVPVQGAGNYSANVTAQQPGTIGGAHNNMQPFQVVNFLVRIS